MRPAPQPALPPQVIQRPYVAQQLVESPVLQAQVGVPPAQVLQPQFTVAPQQVSVVPQSVAAAPAQPHIPLPASLPSFAQASQFGPALNPQLYN